MEIYWKSLAALRVYMNPQASKCLRSRSESPIKFASIRVGRINLTVLLVAHLALAACQNGGGTTSSVSPSIASAGSLIIVYPTSFSTLNSKWVCSETGFEQSLSTRAQTAGDNWYDFVNTAPRQGLNQAETQVIAEIKAETGCAFQGLHVGETMRAQAKSASGIQTFTVTCYENPAFGDLNSRTDRALQFALQQAEERNEALEPYRAGTPEWSNVFRAELQKTKQRLNDEFYCN